MRRLRYSVAATLDGFIADPNGGYDWIIMDDAIDFAAMFDEFDTFVMGRKTWAVSAADRIRSRHVRRQGRHRVLKDAADPPASGRSGSSVRCPVDTVRELKQQPGKDIWLLWGIDVPHAGGRGTRRYCRSRHHAGAAVAGSATAPSWRPAFRE